MEPAPIINKFSKAEIIIQSSMKPNKNQPCSIEKLLVIEMEMGNNLKE